MLWTPCHTIKPRYESHARLIKSHPLSDGIVGCWLFNENAGNKAYDIAYYRHGSLQTGATFGKQGIEFDGAVGRVDVPYNKTFQFKSGGTIVTEFVAYSTGETQGRLVANSTAATGTDGYDYRITGSLLRFSVDAGGNVDSPTTRRIIYGQTYKTAVTWDTAGTVTHYINAKAGTPDASGLPSGVTSTTPLCFGNRPNATDRTWDGNINYVYLFNRPLKANEVLSLYNKPYQFLESARPVFYSFGEATKITTNVYYDVARNALIARNFIKGDFTGPDINGDCYYAGELVQNASLDKEFQITSAGNIIAKEFISE